MGPIELLTLLADDAEMEKESKAKQEAFPVCYSWLWGFHLRKPILLRNPRGGVGVGLAQSTLIRKRRQQPKYYIEKKNQIGKELKPPFLADMFLGTICYISAAMQLAIYALGNELNYPLCMCTFVFWVSFFFLLSPDWIYSLFLIKDNGEFSI